jgi:hypothetical protein
MRRFFQDLLPFKFRCGILFLGVSMELNGVSNIHMLLDQMECNDRPQYMLRIQMKEQLVLLERYMIALDEHKKSIKAGAYGALIVGKEEPYWHDILANPTDFPTNKERQKNG